MSNNQLRTNEKGEDHEKMGEEVDHFKIGHKCAIELNQLM